MLTRLRIKGFKNLRDVDLFFGPFTCVAGPNGVGKSNLFDAISLLGALAAKPVLDALLSVRGTNGRMSELNRLFAPPQPSGTASIEFIADMVVARIVKDDFDREASPTATFLEYSLKLCFDPDRPGGDKDPVYIEHEGLRAKSSSDARKSLPFDPAPHWLSDHLVGPGSRTTPFIETVAGTDVAGPIIKLYGERTKKGGRPSHVPARKSPQTVLSGVNAVTFPTALAVRNELRSWRMLQLEPSALRRPDELHGNPGISSIGEHLPSALLRIGGSGEITDRLSELIPGVMSVEVVTDPVRQTRTLMVKLKDRQSYSASSLSDGTLRFLALAIMAGDPESSGLICMEEPENGIHPKRIPAMLALVQALAEEDQSSAAEPNPRKLRQVLINTHSPVVVALLDRNALLVAETLRFKGREFVNFKPMSGTWRATSGKLQPSDLVSAGDLRAALGKEPVVRRSGATGGRTVADQYTDDMFPSA